MSDAPRDIKSTTNDGQQVTYLSPEEQAQEDRRQAEKSGLKKTKRLSNFLRMFRVSTQDRP